MCSGAETSCPSPRPWDTKAVTVPAPGSGPTLAVTMPQRPTVAVSSQRGPVGRSHTGFGVRQTRVHVPPARATTPNVPLAYTTGKWGWRCLSDRTPG